MNPISVCLAAGNDAFESYSSGVLTQEAGCGTSMDHCITLVGYGTDDDGTDDGAIEGPKLRLGVFDGSDDGKSDGPIEGSMLKLGWSEGCIDGVSDGPMEGSELRLGFSEGCEEGDSDGPKDGS